MTKQKKQLAVIGDPVAHSLSPPMQNAAIRALNLPYHYDKIHVPRGTLKHFLNKEAKKLDGFNLTIPHKEAILPLIDWIARPARIIGAVNTVVRHQGKWLGFNTDGAGYLASLQRKKHYSVMKKKVLILGAGGAARAIAVALILAGSGPIYLANRNQDRVKRLVTELKQHFPTTKVTSVPLMSSQMENKLKVTDLLVNTTSIGLDGTKFEGFPWHFTQKDTLVSDIVYTPRQTPFLKEAKKNGLTTHTGEGMLVHQGALAFQLWTGRYPDVELMQRTLLKYL